MENCGFAQFSGQQWVQSRNFSDRVYEGLEDHDLVHKCAENPCTESWDEFIRRYYRIVASVALHACREWSKVTTDVVEDMVQSTFLKLCADNYALLRRFQPYHQGAFLGYLRRITVNVVYDHFRAEHADKRDVASTTELNDAIHPICRDASSMNVTDMEIFLNEINDLLVRRGCGPVQEKERAIFWLYYRQGLTAREIASIPAVNLTVKGVESVLHRLLLYVREALES